MKYKVSSKITGIAKTQLELLQAEDEVKKISLYLWLAYKFPELFPDKQKAEQIRIELNSFCENSLKSNKSLKPMQRGIKRNFNNRDKYKNNDNKRDGRDKDKSYSRGRSRNRQNDG